MELNQASIDLIKSFEGFVPKWYPDPAHGWKVPTCCYGHTDAAGAPLYAGTKTKIFTLAEGEAILRNDLRGAVATVDKYVRVPLNGNERGALASFVFNLGSGNFASSTLLKKLNAGDRAGAALEFGRWNKAGGKVLAGLTRRRLAEQVLFLTPEGAARPVSVPTPAPEPVIATTPKPRTLGVLIAIIGPILYGIGKFLGVL